MDNTNHTFPDDNPEIEFTDLDSSTHNHTSHEFHFSSRARRWMIAVTVVSAVLFLSFTFGGQLYSLVYKPQPPKISPDTSPSSITLQAVMNGIVYATDPDRMVYAIRASNGSLLWQSFHPDVSQSTSSNGITYTITSSGKISATRMENNALLWTYQLPLSFTLPLTVADNHVYVAAPDGHIYALDATRGSLLWQYRLKFNIAQPVLAAGKYVYIHAASGFLYTLLASNGSLLWQHQLPLGTQLLTTPDTITYFSDNTITALHAGNGSLSWHHHLPSTPVQPLVMANENIYVATFDNGLTALRASNGSLLWHHRLPSLAYEPIAVSHTAVYIHTSDFAIYTLNAITGSPLWSRPVTGVFTFAVTDGIAYIITLASKVEALYSTGTILWQRQLPSTAIQPLIVSGGVLYTGTASGTIYAVRTRDSVLLWHYATQVVQ